ncbi:hypothetical protein ACG873_06655 [Mesorhizobium sp. AaZ16]|uniref:hypothetical protein n=1 Tax=Mesorhizobium sp. AaZ16 TaxID=3402289 RepID=UPI00374E9A86
MSNGPVILHNPHSPDVFADAALGFFTFAGCMRITFETLRSDYSQSPANLDRVVIGRLVMPLAGAEDMAKGILRQIENLKTEQAAEQNATLQ